MKTARSSRKSGNLTTALLVLVLVAGLALLLYPTVSDYWNGYHSSRAIASYSEAVAGLSPEDYGRWLQAARDYNAAIPLRETPCSLNENDKLIYKSNLDIEGNGVMGYIEIPCIDVFLPIYHGTDEGVLQVAAGHLDWTYLPVGGEGTHCVLSGHRGLPSAKLFTNLDKLKEGDLFMLHVLNEELTYRVEQILVVEPKDLNTLQPVTGRDLCTLVTCTPYGINTHRLLVTGSRVDNIVREDEDISLPAEAVPVNAAALAAGLTLVLFLLGLGLAALLRRRRS